MKGLLIAILIIVITFSFKENGITRYAPKPPVGTDSFGCWGYGNIGVSGLIELYTGFDIKGIHITFTAAQIKPTLAGAYNWAIVDSIVFRAVDSGYYIGLQCQFGPDVTPELLDGHHGVDTFYTTRGFGPEGPYPDYFSTTYKTYYFTVLDSILNHIAHYSTQVKNKVLYYQVSEGSTGDTGPYKGEPYNIADTIGTFRWTYDFRYPAWDSIAGFIAASSHPTLRMMLNTGNDGLDLAYARTTFPLCWIKEGLLSHDVQFEGEKNYYARVTPPSRGEVQGYIIKTGSGGSVYKVREGFCLMASALDGDLLMINLPQGWMNNVFLPGQTTADKRPITFFNFYSNNLDRAGFLMPADRPSFDDTIRFPTATYGTLAAPGDSTDKLAKRLYTLQDSLYSPEFKAYRVVKVTSKYLQWSRVVVIRNLFPQLGFVKDTATDPAGNDANDYYDDFNVGGVEYYSQNLNLVDQYNNVTGVARIGADTSMIGRWAAKGDMLVKVANQAKYSSTDRVKVTINYYDSISGNINLYLPERCTTGKLAGQIAITGTRKWLIKSFTIPEMTYRDNTWDFKVSSGSRFVGLIEFENLSK